MALGPPALVSSDLSVTSLVRRNWQDTYDKLVVEDPYVFDRAILVAISALFPGVVPPAEAIMPLVVRQYLANMATIISISTARDHYATRTVISEALEGDTRVRYNWNTVLTSLEESLSNQNSLLKPAVEAWVIDYIDSVSDLGDSAYPKTSSLALCQIWATYPDPCRTYHLTPDPFRYGQGLFNDF
jgi:hypothetical protein